MNTENINAATRHQIEKLQRTKLKLIRQHKFLVKNDRRVEADCVRFDISAVESQIDLLEGQLIVEDVS